VKLNCNVFIVAICFNRLKLEQPRLSQAVRGCTDTAQALKKCIDAYYCCVTMCVVFFISGVLRKKKRKKGKEKYHGLLFLSSRDQGGILVALCFLAQRPFLKDQ